MIKEIIIELLSEGKTVKEVAALTGTNKRTMEKYIDTMRKESGCANITQLVVVKLKEKSPVKEPAY